MELGGNAPFIVFDDADLDAAVAGAMASKYRNTGQTCVCANRILVQDGVYDAFAAKLKAAVEAAEGRQRHGGRASRQGPLINADAVDEGRGAHRRRGGARARRSCIGGKRHALGGNFFEPTILTDVTREIRRSAREETFGPVAPLFRFKTEEEAIAHGQRHRVRPRRPISTRATSAASSAWPRRWNTASSASTRGSSPPRWRRSAA